MGNLIREQEHIFDVFFKDFFNAAERFTPISMTKFNYPVDIFQKDDTLNFNIACVGLTKEDLQLETNEDVLRVIYEKPKEEVDESTYFLKRSITRKSFNFGWKINPRFDLSKAKAKMQNGLLEVSIPMREESKPKTLQIK